MLKKIYENIDINYKNEGKFLADKSYAYDTIFFISKFIINFQVNNVFFKEHNANNLEEYITKVFSLKKKQKGLLNYYNETINFFCLINILKKDKKNNSIIIIKRDILEFIIKRPENAYIVIYLFLKKFLKENTVINNCVLNYLEEKEGNEGKLNTLGLELKKLFYNLNPMRKKNFDLEELVNWDKQLVKYIINNLNFVHGRKAISRELNEKGICNIEIISINVKGTKTTNKKNNDYFKSFDKKYILDNLKDYFISEVKNNTKIEDEIIFESRDIMLADLLIDVQKEKNAHKMTSNEIKIEKNIYIESNLKVRNPKLQNKFRNNLFKDEILDGKCAICGMDIKELLYASHIKPLFKCEVFEESFDLKNGLLLCPQHDSLFEQARFISFNSNREIVIREEINDYKDLFNLNEKFTLDEKIYERSKEYLNWHYENFLNKKTNT